MGTSVVQQVPFPSGRTPRRTRLAGYALAVGATGLLLVSWVLSIDLIGAKPYPLLVLAAASISWHARSRPILLASLLGLAVLAYLGQRAPYVSRLPEVDRARQISLLVLTAFLGVSLLRAVAARRRDAGCLSALDQNLLATMADGALVQDASARLDASQPYFRELLKNAPDGMWVTDLYGYVVLANSRAAELFGYDDPDAMLGMSALELIAPDDRPRAVRDKWRSVRDGSLAQVEYRAQRKDRTSFHLECNLSLVCDVDQPTAILTLAREAPPKHDDETSPAYTSVAWQHVTAGAVGVFGRSASVAEAVPLLLETVCTLARWDAGLYWSFDDATQALRCHTLWHDTTLYVPAFHMLCRQLACVPGMDIPGRAFEERGAVWVDDIVCDPGSPRALMAAREGLHAALCVPVLIRGEVRGVLEFLSHEARPRDEDLVQQISGVASLCARFIDLKEAERSLAYQALHDALTDLPNRTLLQKRLGQALGASREYGKNVALLGIDLDGFKQINDSYGHKQGDLLLQQVALRLRSALRESDTVARMGGDEFSVLLPRTDESAALAVARKIHTALRQPFAVDGNRFEIGGSIGIAVYPDHGGDLESLLHRADVAMYLAKRNGGGCAVYAESMNDVGAGPVRLAAERTAV